MNLSDLANLSQIVAAVGVVISIAYLAVQIRGNTKVVSAQARYGLPNSLCASPFRAEHADRFAKLESGVELTDGDRVFQYRSHVQLMLHAETLFSSPSAGANAGGTLARLCAVYDEVPYNRLASGKSGLILAQVFRKTLRMARWAACERSTET